MNRQSKVFWIVKTVVKTKIFYGGDCIMNDDGMSALSDEDKNIFEKLSREVCE